MTVIMLYKDMCAVVVSCGLVFVFLLSVIGSVDIGLGVLKKLIARWWK